MKRNILILLLFVIVSALHAQNHLFISSENITVASAVTADLITVVNDRLGTQLDIFHVRWHQSNSLPEWNGVWISFNNNNHFPREWDNNIVFYEARSSDVYIISFDYQRSTRALFDLLSVIPNWTQNFQMTYEEWNIIQIIYILDGIPYTVKISFTPAG